MTKLCRKFPSNELPSLTLGDIDSLCNVTLGQFIADAARTLLAPVARKWRSTRQYVGRLRQPG